MITTKSFNNLHLKCLIKNIGVHFPLCDVAGLSLNLIFLLDSASKFFFKTPTSLFVKESDCST
jgi:hypothetical protein